MAATLVDLVLERPALRRRRSFRELVNPGILLGLLIVLLGTLFLLTDVGRLDRVYTLFTQPTFSVASIGAYAILFFSLCAGYVVAVRYLALPEYSAALTRGVELAGGVFALGIMAYTGVLLASMTSVAFWASPFLPVLFILSSLSTGIAILLICARFLSAQKALVSALRIVSRADVLILVLEAVAAVLLLVTMYGDASAVASAKLLLNGAYAEVFWAGYVVCGLLAPLTVLAFLSGRYTSNLSAWLGVLLLVGGFCLRYCVVNAGAHDVIVTPFGVLSYLHMTVPA